MKYPPKQFDKLVAILKELNKYIENLQAINNSSLHYLAYQQVSEGQLHNRLVKTEQGTVISQHVAEGLGFPFAPLFTPDNSFLLYPDGCNDSHIETAVKKAKGLI